jgi:hypothetical protein
MMGLGMLAPIAFAHGGCAGGCCIGAKAEKPPMASVRMVSDASDCCCGSATVKPCKRYDELESNTAGKFLRQTQDSRQSMLTLSARKATSPSPAGMKFSPRTFPRLSCLKTPLYIQTAALLC